MRVLLVHNFYRERGGEDAVFEAERALLESHGDDVTTLQFHNASIADDQTAFTALRLAAGTVWSRSAGAQVAERVRGGRIDVVHFHNTFPLVSPGAYWAARHAGAAVVQTLHNYRLICPVAQFYRDGRPCEDCRGRFLAWPGVVHACYRNSRVQTGVVAVMQSVHRGLGTWRNAVDCYIALTQFARSRFVDEGIDADRILVKPNFVANQPRTQDRSRSGFLFLGRLDESKGILELLEAWKQRRGGSTLQVAGDGPLRSAVLAAAHDLNGLRYLGRVAPPEARALLQEVTALVVPSRLYEGFPLVIAEAFWAGTPVIAAKLGAMAEIVDESRTGLFFQSGNTAELALTLERADETPEMMAAMGRSARREYEEKYDGETNYELLMGAYGHALAVRRARR